MFLSAGRAKLGGVWHEWWIEEREYRRHEQRRGRRHAFESLDPARTALVVVDMVPFFVEQNDYARGVVGNINALVGVVRERGGVVAWVVPDAAPSTAVQVEFYGAAVAETYRTSGGSGPIVDRLWHELVLDAGDVFAAKTAASAFFPGRSDLHEQLVARGVDAVLIAGTVANVCCESTARDAATLGYRVVMVADANAAVRDEDLNATLRTIYRSFGDVRPTSEIIDILG